MTDDTPNEEADELQPVDLISPAGVRWRMTPDPKSTKAEQDDAVAMLLGIGWTRLVDLPPVGTKVRVITEGPTSGHHFAVGRVGEVVGHETYGEHSYVTVRVELIDQSIEPSDFEVIE